MILKMEIVSKTTAYPDKNVTSERWGYITLPTFFEIIREEIEEKDKPISNILHVKLYDDKEWNDPVGEHIDPHKTLSVFGEAYLINELTGKTIERIN